MFPRLFLVLLAFWTSHVDALQMTLTSGCGSTKGCYRSPTGCNSAANCLYFFSQFVENDVITIEIGARAAAWAAVGFSDDKKMGADDVIGCHVATDISKVYAKNMYNEGKVNKLDNNSNPAVNLNVLSTTFDNGWVSCRVSRKVNTGAKNDKDLSEEYYYLFGKNTRAAGRATARAQNLLQMHSSLPYVSQEKHNASDTTNFDAEQENKDAVKAHGIFMITTWIALAGIGLFMPRFMKQAWAAPNWFLAHRAIMVTVWVFTMIGMGLIFSHVQGWSAGEQRHPVFGMITIILCFIQPFIALLRPAPYANNRYIFNWVHRTVGLIAFIFGSLAVFLGMERYMNSFDVGTRPRWAWIVWFIVEAIIWLSLELKQTLAPLPAPPKGEVIEDYRQRLIFLVAYVLQAIVFVIVMLAYVGKAPQK